MLDTDILLDELFDGWLAAPAMAGFLVENPSPTSSQQSPKSSTTSSSTSNEVSPENTSEDSFSSQNFDNALARQRRTHTKSRLGCTNCKTRRIKCQETWPACGHCKRRGLSCRYPTAPKRFRQEYIAAKVASGSVHTLRLSDTPEMFSALDMRLFHHYLTVAYPSIPHNYEYIWTKEVAMFSHRYSYLMHAILGQSASHIGLFLDDIDVNIALGHRQKAIVGLEDAFTRWPTSAEEAHVMLATSYLLAFQSSYMPDAFLDHILSLRGCSSISQMIVDSQFEGAFSINPDVNDNVLEMKFRNFPNLNQELAREALCSIASLAPLVKDLPPDCIEKALVAQLAETIRQLLLPGKGPESESISPSDRSRSNSGQYPVSKWEFLAEAFKRPYVGSPLIPVDLVVKFEDMPWETIATVPPDSAPCPRRSFEAVISTLHVLFTCPSDSIIHLFSPDNKLGLVILSHFIALRCIISPLSAPENVMRTPVSSMVEWFEQTVDAVEDDDEGKWTKYVLWPRKIQQCLRHCLNRKRGLNFGDLLEIVVHDPVAYNEGRGRRVNIC